MCVMYACVCVCTCVCVCVCTCVCVCVPVPPPHDAEAQPLARLLVELQGERVPHVLLPVLRLVAVHGQAHTRGRLTEHVDGLVVGRHAEVDAVHLWAGGRVRRFMPGGGPVWPLCALALLNIVLLNIPDWLLPLNGSFQSS